MSEEAGTDWSDREVLIVTDHYFRMLKAERRGQPYVKAHHNRQVRELLTTRTKGSVERKFQNVSAVLDSLGVPWIQGYKPLSNSQAALRDAVAEALDADGELAELLGLIPLEPDDRTFVEPPDSRRAASERSDTVAPPGMLAGLASQSAVLGLHGEHFALEAERVRLLHSGHPDLAARVEHVASTVGDGLGYDIRSFESDGTARCIEVKTTTGGPTRSFFVSPRELRASQELGDRFYLYRVFSFGSQPRIWWRRGPLDSCFELRASEYRAYVQP